MVEEWFDSTVCVPTLAIPVDAMYKGSQYRAAYMSGYWEIFDSSNDPSKAFYFDGDKRNKPELWRPSR